MVHVRLQVLAVACMIGMFHINPITFWYKVSLDATDLFHRLQGFLESLLQTVNLLCERLLFFL